MPVYGERAMDLVFDFGGIAGGRQDDFDLATFFGQIPPIRITSLSSNAMILEKLKLSFGENEQFGEGIANAMKENMLKDLRENRKEEYMSDLGK